MTDTDNNMGDGCGSCGASSTSSSLLRGLRDNNQEAWQRMARLYGPLVFRWAIRAGLRREDSLDVVQEVFRTTAAKVAQFRRDRDGDTFRGWLRSITRNKVGDHLRRRWRQPEGAGGSSANERFSQVPAPAQDDSPSSTSSATVGGLYQRALELIRSEFEARTWEAFWKVVVEDRSPADVATELGMSKNAVYLAKARVLRRLRQALGDADG